MIVKVYTYYALTNLVIHSHLLTLSLRQTWQGAAYEECVMESLLSVRSVSAEVQLHTLLTEQTGIFLVWVRKVQNLTFDGRGCGVAT